MRRILKLVLLIIIPTIFSTSYAIKIVCIAGGTGAGKTTIARKLLENMGDRAMILSQDSYYRDLSHLSIDERKKVNFDHPDSIEFELLRKHLLQLKKGEVIKVPNYDFTKSNRMKEVTSVAPKDILILEGILLLAVPEIRELVDIKVFVDVEDDVRLLRRIKRDVEERGRTISNVQDQYMATVRPMHQKFVAPSKQYADIIIPHGAENIVAIDLLFAQLREITERVDLAKAKKSSNSVL